VLGKVEVAFFFGGVEVLALPYHPRGNPLRFPHIFHAQFFHQAGTGGRIRQVRPDEQENRAMPATKTKPHAGKSSHSLGAQSVANCEVLRACEVFVLLASGGNKRGVIVSGPDWFFHPATGDDSDPSLSLPRRTRAAGPAEAF